jgi:hypothetical protein
MSTNDQMNPWLMLSHLGGLASDWPPPTLKGMLIAAACVLLVTLLKRFTY